MYYYPQLLDVRNKSVSFWEFGQSTHDTADLLKHKHRSLQIKLARESELVFLQVARQNFHQSNTNMPTDLQRGILIFSC